LVGVERRLRLDVDRAAGDRGNDRDLAAVAQLGVRAVEVANVFLVVIDVDERAQLPLVVEEMLAEGGVLSGELSVRLSGRAGGDVIGGLAASELAERRGDSDLGAGHLGTHRIVSSVSSSSGLAASMLKLSGYRNCSHDQSLLSIVDMDFHLVVALAIGPQLP